MLEGDTSEVRLLRNNVTVKTMSFEPCPNSVKAGVIGVWIVSTPMGDVGDWHYGGNMSRNSDGVFDTTSGRRCPYWGDGGGGLLYVECWSFGGTHNGGDGAPT